MDSVLMMVSDLSRIRQLRDEFESTEAYSALFMDLVLDTDSAIEFINGVIPSGMAEETAKLTAPDIKPVESVTVIPNPKPDATVIKKADLIAMSYEDVLEAQKRIASGDAKLEE